MAMKIDLGAVSAYAVAVKNGFVGTEAEWEEYIANASIKAQEAAASAEAAETASGQAETYASEAMSTTPEGYNDMVEHLAQPWVSEESVDVGDYRWYMSVLYRCIEANNDAEFDSSKWKEAVLVKETSDLNAQCDIIVQQMTTGTAEWELGGINATTGEDVDPLASNRIRTGFFPLDPVLRLRVEEGAKLAIRTYDEDKVFVGNAGSWHYGSFRLMDKTNAMTRWSEVKYVRFVGAYDDDATVTDVDALAAMIHVDGLMSHDTIKEAYETEMDAGYVKNDYKRIFPEWAYGNLGTSSYQIVSGKTRAHTDFISVDEGIRLNAAAGYQYSIRKYETDGKPISATTWYSVETLVAPTDCALVRICVSDIEGNVLQDPNQAGAKITIERKGAVKWPTVNAGAEPNSPNFTPDRLTPEYMILEYVRESYKAGEMSKTLGYLFRTATPPYKFYYADGKPENLHYLFTWDQSLTVSGNKTPLKYAYCMTHEGDVLCVWHGDIASESNGRRNNPIVYSYNSETGEYTGTVVQVSADTTATYYTDETKTETVTESYTGLKPSAWHSNCGVFAEENNVWFGEYTRPALGCSNVWHVQHPYTNAANWSISKTYALDPNPDDVTSMKPGRIEHIHHVTRDPFSGILYCTTGDHYTEARIDYMDGNGWHELIAGDEKHCRQLNFIWTGNYIFWASDAWRYWDPDAGEYATDEHNFFIARRGESGLIDVDSIMEINIPDLAISIVTYRICYVKDPECILILDRHDTKASAFEMPYRVFDLRDWTMKAAGTMRQVEGNSNITNLFLGFRAQCIQHYPNLYDNRIHVGFALNPNVIDVCGNPLPPWNLGENGNTSTEAANASLVNNMWLEVKDK